VFSDEDKRRIVEEATRPDASLSAVARHHHMPVPGQALTIVADRIEVLPSGHVR
jgi:hypothetical protein